MKEAKRLNLDPQPITDPIQALLDLGGDAVALVGALRTHVDALQAVGTEPGANRWSGETVKPELQAFIAALREAERILSSLARLDLAERMVRLDESRAELVAKVITKVLTRAGLDTNSIDVKSWVSAELLAVSAA
jgi:hypothetical protein